MATGYEACKPDEISFLLPQLSFQPQTAERRVEQLGTHVEVADLALHVHHQNDRND